MRLSTFTAMLKQQFLLLTRYPVNLAANFITVLIIVIVVTLLMTTFAPPGLEEQLKQITLCGFILYIFLSHTIWTAGMSLHKEKVEGTLTGLYLTPASHFFSLLARSLTALTWTALAGFIGLLIAQVMAGPVEFYQPGLALLILLFTLGGLIGLGFAVAGLAVRFGETMELAANLLEFGLLGLCAFFFPFAVLPAALQGVARLIPLSYTVDAFRTVAMGQSQPELLPLPVELLIIVLTGLLGPPVGYMVYRLNEITIRRQGGV
jgi:ABC-2 type transport system permease protein